MRCPFTPFIDVIALHFELVTVPSSSLYWNTELYCIVKKSSLWAAVETSIRPQEKYTPEYCSGQACNSQHSTAHLCDKTGLYIYTVASSYSATAAISSIPQAKGPLKGIVHNCMSLKGIVKHFWKYEIHLLSCWWSLILLPVQYEADSRLILS